MSLGRYRGRYLPLLEAFAQSSQFLNIYSICKDNTNRVSIVILEMETFEGKLDEATGEQEILGAAVAVVNKEGESFLSKN